MLSLWAKRLNRELKKAFPERRYVAYPNNEILHVVLHGEGKPQKRFALSSPQLGLWLLEVREGRKWVAVGLSWDLWRRWSGWWRCSGNDRRLKGAGKMGSISGLSGRSASSVQPGRYRPA